MQKGLVWWIAGFVMTMCLVAVLFWVYLNIAAQMHIEAERASLQLPHTLTTQIDLSDHLQTQAIGRVDTNMRVDQQLILPLQGQYLTHLSFEVATPVTVAVDYETDIRVDTIMPLDTTTDLIYQSKFLPKFPLKLNIPVHLSIPFKLKKNYQVPIKIHFNAPTLVAFDELLDVHLKHQFSPTLLLNDPLLMKHVDSFSGVMKLRHPHNSAQLRMDLSLPFNSVRP